MKKSLKALSLLSILLTSKTLILPSIVSRSAMIAESTSFNSDQKKRIIPSYNNTVEGNKAVNLIISKFFSGLKIPKYVYAKANNGEITEDYIFMYQHDLEKTNFFVTLVINEWIRKVEKNEGKGFTWINTSSTFNLVAGETILKLHFKNKTEAASFGGDIKTGILTIKFLLKSKIDIKDVHFWYKDEAANDVELKLDEDLLYKEITINEADVVKTIPWYKVKIKNQKSENISISFRVTDPLFLPYQDTISNNNNFEKTNIWLLNNSHYIKGLMSEAEDNFLKEENSLVFLSDWSAYSISPGIYRLVIKDLLDNQLCIYLEISAETVELQAEVTPSEKLPEVIMATEPETKSEKEIYNNKIETEEVETEEVETEEEPEIDEEDNENDNSLLNQDYR